MGAIFVVMSSVVSNPPPELQVADALITRSVKVYVPAIMSAVLWF